MFAQRATWLVPVGLIVLSMAPILGGAVRLTSLIAGVEITAENARFFAAPLPVVVHILSAVPYCVLGALQFSSGLRRSRPRWHRAAGRLLVPLGLVAALSGLWMTQFYPAVEHDGVVLYGMRWLMGSAMAAAIGVGFVAIRRRDIAAHRAWMMRAYAIGIGAGTQALTHIPYFAFESLHNEAGRTLCMGAGWAINIAVAEWFISRR